MAPAAVTNLTAIALPVECDLMEGHVKLKWTAQADDSTFSSTGPATAFDVRYSLSPITDANWAGANSVQNVPTPVAPGDTQSVIVTGLDPSTRYYFRVKAKDNRAANGNWSVLCTEASTTTKPPCEGFAGGGGGGGGGMVAELMTSSAQAALTDAANENSLFDGAAPGQSIEDFLRLPALDPLTTDANVWIRAARGREADLDGARLLAVDHSPGVRAFVLGAKIVLGNPSPPTRATTGDKQDVTALLNGSGEPFVGEAGVVVMVELGADESGSGLVILDASNGGWPAPPESSGVLVQVPDGAAWRTVAQVHGRRTFAESAVDCGAAGLVRLVFLSPVQLRFVGRLALAAEPPSQQWATLASAIDSKQGDVATAIGARDLRTMALVGADTLQMRFAPPPLAPNMAREWYLVATATVSPLTAAALASWNEAQPSLPVHFALAQNQPNPFGTSTTIRFELPVGTAVRLEVFDTQGRRVRELANRYFAAGYQSVTWDGKDDVGRQAGPGVYFYRMEAAAFRDRKKMILLP